MWLYFVLAALQLAVTQAFSLAALRWDGLATKRYVLVAKATQKNVPITGRAAVAPLEMTIRDESDNVFSSDVPLFTAKSDKTIVWGAAGFCLEADESSDTVHVNRCTGSEKQLWNWLPVGQGGKNQIQLEGTNKCVDVDGGLNGASVGLRECVQKSSELWHLEEPILEKSSMRPMVMSGISVAALAVLSLSAWLWRLQALPRVPVPTPGMDLLRVDQGGISLTEDLNLQPEDGHWIPRLSAKSQRVVPAVMAMPVLEKPVAGSDAAEFKSDGAKKQVGNQAFLNQKLLDRARLGPGAKSDAKLKIGIVGSGLAGMVAAMDLADAGHDVEIFERRPFVGGKVGSWKDKDGNHIEVGLHVFFGCYYNLFGIMQRVGAIDEAATGALRLKEHTHIFINKGGGIGELDFRFPIGAPVNALQAFFKTEQLEWSDKLANALRLGTSPIVRALVDFDGGMDMVRELDDITFSEWFTSFGGSRGSIERLWDPIAYALGFIDCDHISARCMLTIFMLFAIRTEASVLRFLEGSPQTYLHDPIIKYLEHRGVKINLGRGVRELIHDVDEAGKPIRVRGIRTGDKDEDEHLFDVVVSAQDVPGIKKILPESFRKIPMFDNIYQLDTVPIATVQLRFDGWVTEMQDEERMMSVKGDLSDGRAFGIDNLLYSADAEFSCFADLALTSPGDYYKEGEGSLMQCVVDERAYSRSNEKIVADVLDQLHELFPSSRKLKCTWSNVAKLGQALYREKPGQDKFRPTQATPVDNFFLAGSYTNQDYLDSMEGATRSGLMVADEIIARAEGIARAANQSKTGAGAKTASAV